MSEISCENVSERVMKGYKAIYNVQKGAKSSKIVKKLPNTELNVTKYKQGFYYLQDSQCFAD